MTIDLPLSGIAHGRSGGELTVMRDAAGGPAFGRLGAPRGRSAVAGREGEPVAPGPGCGAAGRCARGAGFPPSTPAQVMLAGDRQPAGEPATHGAGHRCADGVPCGRVRRAADNPAAGRGDDGAAGVSELPGTIPDQELDASSALAGVHQELARCRRAPQSYDRSPARPAVEWRVARMLGFDGGHATPVPAHQRGRDRSRGRRDPAPRTSITKRERRRSCIQVRRTLNAD